MIAVDKLSDAARLIYPQGCDCHRDYEVSGDGVVFSAFENGDILVDKLLDHADLKLDWYIPSLEAVEFFMFIRLVLGEEPENLNSKPQYFFIDSVFKNPNIEPFYQARGINIHEFPNETVILASREFSKSVLTTYLILYMAYKGEFAMYGKINYGLYVSDSMRNGVKKMMGRLKAVYYESEFLQAQFEEASFTQEEAILIRHPRTPKEVKLYEEYVNVQKKSKELVPGRMKRTFKVDGLGCLTSSRGASNALTRPQFCHEIGTIVNTDMGTHKVEDYYKKGEERLEHGYEIKLVGLDSIERVTNEHRYWAKETIDDVGHWIAAKNLRVGCYLGNSADSTWRKVLSVDKTEQEHIFIPIQTPTNVYTTEFGLSHNCFIDDVVGNEVDASSDTILASIESTIEADIRGGLSGSGYFMVVIGTPYNKRDPVYRRVEEGLMLPVVFPRAAKMPMTGMKEEEFESVWPDRHNFKKCRMEYKNAKKAEDDGNGYKMKKLSQEHYLRITNSKDKLVKNLDNLWFSTKSLGKHLDGYKLVMTTDYTASNNLTGDYSVIYMWAINSNRDWFMIDMSVKKQTIEQQYTSTMQMVQKWKQRTGKHVEVAVEVDGQQKLNIYSLKQAQIKDNIWFSFSKQIGNKSDNPGFSRRKAGGDKHSQFMRIHYLFENEKIFFPEEFKDTPDMIELIEELKYITYDSINSKFDDCGTYDTRVDTPTGYTLLGELRNGDAVIGYNTVGSAVCKAKDVRITGIKPIVNIRTTEGTVLRFSEFHPVLTETGYVLIRDLTIGDKIVKDDKWRQQLNMVDLSGLENLKGTTNQRQEYQTEVERTGYTNSNTKRSMVKYLQDTMSTTWIMIKKIMTPQTLSYCYESITRHYIHHKIETVVSYLQSMLKNISTKFKHLLNLESKESTLVERSGQNCQTNQLNVLSVARSSYHIRKLEKILNSAAQLVRESGLNESVQEKFTAQTVEMYSNRLLIKLKNVKNAEVKHVQRALTDCIQRYVESAEIRSKALLAILTVEKNAVELAQIDVRGKLVQIEEIWVSAPEPTYNFDVDETHNYQVHDGYVVHNCLDGISAIGTLDIIYPAETVSANHRTKDSDDYDPFWDDDKIDKPDSGAGY